MTEQTNPCFLCDRHEQVILKVERLATTVRNAGYVLGAAWTLMAAAIGLFANRSLATANTIAQNAIQNAVQERQMAENIRRIDSLERWRETTIRDRAILRGLPDGKGRD